VELSPDSDSVGSSNGGRRQEIFTRLGAITRFLTWSYLLALVGAWLLLRLAGDSLWPATRLLYGPRWFLAAPLLLLWPCAFFVRPRPLVPLVASSLLAVGLLQGLYVPFARLAVPNEVALRLLTLNMNGGWFDAAPLGAESIRDSGADLVVHVFTIHPANGQESL